MALLNRPLTKQEMDELMSTPMDLLRGDSFLKGMHEPSYTYVNYSAAHNDVAYTPPNAFYWWQSGDGPSDSTWMVPGTEEPWYKRSRF